jgi:hypothetical protein
VHREDPRPTWFGLYLYRSFRDPSTYLHGAQGPHAAATASAPDGGAIPKANNSDEIPMMRKEPRGAHKKSAVIDTAKRVINVRVRDNCRGLAAFSLHPLAWATVCSIEPATNLHIQTYCEQGEKIDQLIGVIWASADSSEAHI